MGIESFNTECPHCHEETMNTMIGYCTSCDADYTEEEIGLGESVHDAVFDVTDDDKKQRALRKQELIRKYNKKSTDIASMEIKNSQEEKPKWKPDGMKNIPVRAEVEFLEKLKTHCKKIKQSQREFVLTALENEMKKTKPEEAEPVKVGFWKKLLGGKE